MVRQFTNAWEIVEFLVPCKKKKKYRDGNYSILIHKNS